MSKQKKFTAERHHDFDLDADIERPEKNPGWTIMTSQQVIVANNKRPRLHSRLQSLTTAIFKGVNFNWYLVLMEILFMQDSPSKIIIYCMSPNITSWIRPVHPPSATKP
jgi:hypothetical protein